MSTKNLTNLARREEAQKNSSLNFSCIDSKSVESEKRLLRQALILLTSLSDYQNLGICADTAAQGFLAFGKLFKGSF